MEPGKDSEASVYYTGGEACVYTVLERRRKSRCLLKERGRAEQGIGRRKESIMRCVLIILQVKEPFLHLPYYSRSDLPCPYTCTVNESICVLYM